MCEKNTMQERQGQYTSSSHAHSMDVRQQYTTNGLEIMSDKLKKEGKEAVRLGGNSSNSAQVWSDKQGLDVIEIVDDDDDSVLVDLNMKLEAVKSEDTEGKTKETPPKRHDDKSVDSSDDDYDLHQAQKKMGTQDFHDYSDSDVEIVNRPFDYAQVRKNNITTVNAEVGAAAGSMGGDTIHPKSAMGYMLKRLKRRNERRNKVVHVAVTYKEGGLKGNISDKGKTVSKRSNEVVGYGTSIKRSKQDNNAVGEARNIKIKVEKGSASQTDIPIIAQVTVKTETGIQNNVADESGKGSKRDVIWI